MANDSDGKGGRDPRGRILPGTVLNPSGRTGKRGALFMERLGELTHNGEALLEGLLELAKDKKSPATRLRALVYLSERWLGPLQKQAPDQDPLDEVAQLSDDELAEQVEQVLKQRKEEQDAEAEVGAVPDVGGADEPDGGG